MLFMRDKALKLTLLLICSVNMFGVGAAYSSDIKLSVNWELTAAFKSPESAAVSEKHGVIFVSNVNGYTTNGQGFISRLSMAGELIELAWLSGINAPTGLAVQGETLWAVDFNRLLKINISSAAIVGIFPSPDDNPLLNDVAVTNDGDVFVTGSASATVYQLVDDRLVSWVKDTTLLKDANGITAHDNEVVVAAYHLVRINREDEQLAVFGDTSILYDLEGVKEDGKGGYYVSMIGERPAMHMNGAGTLMPLFHGQPYIADFDIGQGQLIAPTGASSVSAFLLP